MGRDPIRLPRKPVDGSNGEEEPFWIEEDPEEETLAAAIEDAQEATQSLRAKRRSEHDLEPYVLAFIAESDKAPGWRDREVFHPSELGKEDFCRRLEVFKRSLPKPLVEAEIDPERFAYFSIGKAVHRWWQNNVLGKARVLKGAWECTRCKVWVDGFMPNHPCTTCQWPLPRRTYMAIKKGPVITKDRGVIARPKWYDPAMACERVCRWPGGFDAKMRDCAKCELGGGWEYVEPSIVYPELEIAGHCDGVVVLRGEEYVLELKTVSPFVFPKLEEPYPEHHYQVSLYMHVLKKKKALIPYVDKGNGRIKTFLVEEDPDAWKDAKKQITSIQKALKSGDLPRGICETSRERTAKACPYREECFSGYETIKAIKASLEKQKTARAAFMARKKAAEESDDD